MRISKVLFDIKTNTFSYDENVKNNQEIFLNQRNYSLIVQQCTNLIQRILKLFLQFVSLKKYFSIILGIKKLMIQNWMQVILRKIIFCLSSDIINNDIAFFYISGFQDNSEDFYELETYQTSFIRNYEEIIKKVQKLVL